MICTTARVQALNSITGFEQVSHIALWTAQIILFTTLAIFTLIGLLRARLNFREERAAALISVWRPVLAAAAFSQGSTRSAVLPTVKKRDIVLFLRQWSAVQETVSGDASIRLNGLARRLQLDEVALKLLDHRRISMRLLATVVLGHMRVAEAWLPVWKDLDSQNTLVSLVSANALTQICPSRAIPELIARIPVRHDWPADRIASILAAADPHNSEEPFKSALLEATPNPQHTISLLKFVPIFASPSIDELVTKILINASDPSLIAACLRVLSNPAQLPFARKLVTHDEWYVRVLAIRFLGQTGTVDDTKRVVRALMDEEWWVRYRAAQALCHFPWIDLKGLRKIQQEQSDDFARDILEQAISEAKFE